MSDFSQLLSNHIHNKSIKTSLLAQYCELDRSNMYKIINGKRNPSSLEMVQKICKFLNLSYKDQQELENAYEIAILGSEKYYRRKDTLNFFTNFKLPHLNFIPYENFEVPAISPEIVTTLPASFEVNASVLHIITEELKNPAGHIRMLLQPDYDFLIHLLATGDYGHSNLLLEHIICLNNSSSSSFHNYNLHCMEKLLPLYGNAYQYNCYYYYDKIESKLNLFSAFPYMILTSNYACLLTADFHRGYLTSDIRIREMLTDIFDQYLSILTPLLRPFTDITSRIQYMLDLNKNITHGYSFQMSPCMFPYFTVDLMEKYIIPDFPHRQEIIFSLNRYISETFGNTSSICITRICSIDGIRKFMDTGILSEFPSDIYTPLDVTDRIILLKHLLHDSKNQPLKILKKNIGELKNELFLYITQTRGVLTMCNSNNQLISLDIDEPGLNITFWDFCQSLNEKLFYTNEEAETELKKLVHLYHQQLKK